MDKLRHLKRQMMQQTLQAVRLAHLGSAATLCATPGAVAHGAAVAVGRGRGRCAPEWCQPWLTHTSQVGIADATDDDEFKSLLVRSPARSAAQLGAGG